MESGFSRIPAYDGSIDNVVGLVYVKDALRLLEKGQPVVIRKILHPVHFVPETKKVGDLLKELQKRRTHMALVIDEHGSVTGLVTLEDLLEEIVGEIQDEYDWEERPVERLRDGSLVVEGTVSAAQLRESYEVPLPESEEFQTVAGFMLERLGRRCPRAARWCPSASYRLTVVDVEKNRISKVKIEKVPAVVAGAELVRLRPGLSGSRTSAGESGSEASRGAGWARPGAARSRGGGGQGRGRRLEEERRVLASDQEGPQLVLLGCRPSTRCAGSGS